jgi:hypothetical protein
VLLLRDQIDGEIDVMECFDNSEDVRKVMMIMKTGMRSLNFAGKFGSLMLWWCVCDDRVVMVERSQVLF